MHDTLLYFSNFGRVYWLKVYQLPQASRLARGKPLVNLFPLTAGEGITAILSIEQYAPDHYIVMATAKGVVKKVSLSAFSRPRPGGIIAVSLGEGDRLVGVDLTTGQNEIFLFSNGGKAARFSETSLRPLGRTARGVRGIRLKENEEVIALIVHKHQGAILIAAENGFGKRTLVDTYRLSGRSAQGVIAMKTSERNGKVVGALEVLPGDEVMLISDRGRLVRTRVDEVSIVSRSAQGVILIRLDEGEKLVGMQKIAEQETGLEGAGLEETTE